MPNYRRLRTPGATYFFTVVTYARRRILCESFARQALRAAINEVRDQHPFRVEAWVLLPDHLHCVWRLPVGDDDYSKRWGLIKAGFTKTVRQTGWVFGSGPGFPASRARNREASTWQRRFWEHQIRDEEDFRRHCDYIHYNPVKHGLVDDPKKWQCSTIHQFIQKGLYEDNWGDSVESTIAVMELE
jgi:putative transposase